MHDRTWLQPLLVACLQPCLISDRRGILKAGAQETWGEKPAAYEKQQASHLLRQHSLQGQAEVPGLVHSAGRWNLEQALHCCIMGCGPGRPLTSSSLRLT